MPNRNAEAELEETEKAVSSPGTERVVRSLQHLRSRADQLMGLIPDGWEVRSLGVSVINLLVPAGLGSPLLVGSIQHPSPLAGASAPAKQLQGHGSEYDLSSLKKWSP